MTQRNEAFVYAQAADAAKWLQKAEDVGLRPNIITYNCVIHACARVGHPKKAGSRALGILSTLLIEVLGVKKVLDSSGDQAIEWFGKLRAAQLQPDVASYCGILDAFAKRLGRGSPKMSTGQRAALGNVTPVLSPVLVCQQFDTVDCCRSI